YEKINRASAAEIIAKAFGLTPTKSAGFSDVPADAWFAKSVNAVVEAGYFEGTGNNKFSPNAEFSRAQAAKVIVDAFELEGEADLSSFPDADEIPSWAKDEKNYVAIAVQNGIIEGKGTKDAAKLAPNDTITRAEFAVMVDRAITLKEDPQEEEKLVVESVSAINNTNVTLVDGKLAEDFNLASLLSFKDADGNEITEDKLPKDLKVTFADNKSKFNENGTLKSSASVKNEEEITVVATVISESQDLNKTAEFKVKFVEVEGKDVVKINSAKLVTNTNIDGAKALVIDETAELVPTSVTNYANNEVKENINLKNQINKVTSSDNTVATV